MLTKEEKKRNSLGEAILLQFSNRKTFYGSSLPNVLPDITQCYCQMESFKSEAIPVNKKVNVLCPGARLGSSMLPGFPSVHSIPHSFSIIHHGVNVFNADSKNPSVILTLQNMYNQNGPESIAELLFGNKVFTGWPFLIESRVTALYDELFKYTRVKSNGTYAIAKEPHDNESFVRFQQSLEKAEVFYSKRRGVVLGHIELVAEVQILKGLQLLNDGSLVKEFVKKGDFHIPVQTILTGDYEDPRFKVKLVLILECFCSSYST
jgi:5'-3' exoribonuclease 1